jgi:hypothetical protein
MGDQVIFAKLLESKYLGAQAGSSMATVTKEGSRTQKDFGVRGFCIFSRGAKIHEGGHSIDKFVAIKPCAR